MRGPHKGQFFFLVKHLYILRVNELLCVIELLDLTSYIVFVDIEGEISKVI